MKKLIMRKGRLKVQNQISHLKKKEAKLEKKNEESEILAINLQQDIEGYTNVRNELNETNTLIESDLVSTFCEGKYINEVRRTIMSLLTECNVSLYKVNKVITKVLKNLPGKLPEQLPSSAVLSRLLVEACGVAYVQVAEAMIQGANIEEFIGN